jgi:hypothetical protein
MPEIDLGFRPRPYQLEAFRAHKRFTVLVWHRRCGKTVYAVMRLIRAALKCRLPMGEFGIIAPKLKQAKKNAWKYLKHYSRAIPDAVVNESELFVMFPGSGAKVRLYGADDPDSIRGDYFDEVVLDEVAQMKPEIWGQTVRPMLADRKGGCLFIGTPKGTNLFSEKYYEALANEGPEWHAELRRWDQTNALPPEEIEALRRDMTEAEFKQEMECDFAAGCENSLLDLYAVRDAMARDPDEDEYRFAPRVLGVDLARLGGDRVCIFPRQGVVALKPRIFKPASLVGDGVMMQVAGQVASVIDSFQPHATFIDKGGMGGGGVIDRLTQLGYRVIGIDFGGSPTNPRFANKRSEMWKEMADWVRDEGALPNLPALIQDLTGPTYDYKNARDKFALESKDDMRARGLPSPDAGDALALTFAQPVAQPDFASMLPGARAKRQWDYDPLRGAA